MRECINIIGKKFGLLLVLERCNFKKSNEIIYKCMCDCGTLKEAMGRSLRNGDADSCGCLTQEKLKKRHLTHGLSKSSPLYGVWEGMKQRCYNPNSTSFHRYGGRGIIICDEWKNDFKSFNDWAISNGWEKGLELDRKNNDGIYEPSNCRFVSRHINTKNRSSNKIIAFNGQSKCLSEWALKLGIRSSTLIKRLKRWPLEKALSSEPLRRPINKLNKNVNT